MSFLESVGSWFLENEMVAILLSLCLGHLIGKINFGRFTLGSTVGTLLVAMIIGQSGTFSISSTAQMLFFMLCVFAIGYESGPAFVKGFRNAGMRVIGLSLFFVVVGTGLTVGLCKACGLDAGTSAGIFAGSLTQTAVIGTAGDAIASLGLDEAATAALQSNVSISYALTYFFGMAGVIVLIQRVEPAILRVDLKKAALEKAAAMGYQEETKSDGSIVEKQKETDVSFVTFGIIIGLIIGGVSIKAGYIPLTLGSGCGGLVLGMIMGCVHEKHPKIGYIPASTRWFMIIVGLNVFIACTGLGAGKNFVTALQTMGLKIFLVGIGVALGTHLLTMCFGRFVLKLDVPDVLGTQAGTGTIVAALNALIDRTGSSVFAISYAPAYAIGNILLTILGPVVIFLMA